MPRRPRHSFLVEAAFLAVAAVAALGVRASSRAGLPTEPAQGVGPVGRATVAYATAPVVRYVAPARSAAELRVDSAVATLAPSVRALSHPRALEDAVRSYYAYRAEHPETKPYLYFVDYGLPSTTPRGYLFDMDAREVVEGPFAVAHGRGSSEDVHGVPTRFSNAFGSAATSLGLYVARELYPFRGHTAYGTYASLGMRLDGVSKGFNDAALARRVVAHGAPYVTDSKAGRSEGCPALEPSRAARLLPRLANGGLVFLFAPNRTWMAGDPWVSAPLG